MMKSYNPNYVRGYSSYIACVLFPKEDWCFIGIQQCFTTECQAKYYTYIGNTSDPKSLFLCISKTYSKDLGYHLI